MKKYNVVLTDDAVKDIDYLHNYIKYHLRSPITAQRQCARISKAIFSLELFPERYKVFAYEDEEPIRRMVIDNFSVFYLARNDYVYVLHIFYSKSDLKERLKR